MKYPILGLVVLLCALLCACEQPTVAPAESADRPGPTSPAQPLPIIDMHMHSDLPPMPVPAGAPGICRPEPCVGGGHATADHAETMEKTLAAMERYNIVKAFLSGIDPEVAAKWTEAAPGRFVVGQFILQPGKPDAATLRERAEAGKLDAIGEIATQLAGIRPDDPALEPYFALADELDVPVLIHTLGIGPEIPTFRVAAGSPVFLEDVLVRHPDLRMSVENCGYPFRGEMIAMMSQYPQLHCDVSTITWILPREAFHDYLTSLVRAGLGQRIMFGSDQMRWPDRIGEAIAAIEDAPLSEQQKRDIFYNNAARFLRLER